MTFSALDSELLGPLFASDAMRDVFSDRRRVAAMLQVESALARAEARFRLVPKELATAIDRVAAGDLDLAALGREIALAGVPAIPFVKAVQARLPKELEPHFHRGATTQDVVDTALVLQMREAFGLIADDLAAIIAALARLAKKYRAAPCVGRTFGQHAAPITFGFRAAVWLSGIADAAAVLAPLRARVLAASLGGPVGTLAGLGEAGPAVLDALADALGLAAPVVTWHALRGRMAETGAWLATLIGTLAKMAADVAQLASTEVGEVAEPHIKGRGGSSAMPHKRNPVSSIVILAAHAAAKGHLATLLDAMAAAGERPVGIWHAEWHALPALFGLVSGALREALSLAEGLAVDAKRMRANLDVTHGLIFADAASARLAAKLGRAAAHAVVERAADEVRRTGRPLQAILSAEPSLAEELRRDVAAAFDLAPATAAAAAFADRAIADAKRIGKTLTKGETLSMPQVKANGVSLHYELSGPATAPVILFSHSIGATLDMWDAQVAAFAGRYRCLRYDTRGHGSSEVIDRPARVDDLADDMAGLLDALGIAKAHVVGLSLGGMTAQAFALRHADRLERLVLIATTAKMDPPFWQERAALVRREGYGSFIETVLTPRWFTPDFAKRSPQTIAAFRERFPKDWRGYAVCCGVIETLDLPERIGAIQTPTLIMVGADDPATPVAMSEDLRNRIPHSELLILPRLAHLLVVERPDLVNPYLAAFLERDRVEITPQAGGASFAAGLANRKAVLGAEHVERSLAAAGTFGMPWQDFITRLAWGEIWGDPTLAWKTRSLVTLAMMVALHREEEFKLHLRAALRNGVTVAELGALIRHGAVYAGVPAGNAAMRWSREVLGEELK